MNKLTILSILSFLIISSASMAQSFCPLPYPDANGSVAACAADDHLANRLLCPTQEECNRGWQYASPSSTMTTYPLAYSDSFGLQVCYLSGAIGDYEPKCPSNFPSSVTLYTWCQRVRDLGAVQILNFNLVGVCGSTIPVKVKETLEMAPEWVTDKRARRRLIEVLRWSRTQ